MLRNVFGRNNSSSFKNKEFEWIALFCPPEQNALVFFFPRLKTCMSLFFFFLSRRAWTLDGAWRCFFNSETNKSCI
uniref:Uncharacterized protein n=1 Tax=Zea mays TaxID=4577 RepID=B6UAF1_MAIZE|nr:hypothetical protein [Zea mays]